MFHFFYFNIILSICIEGKTKFLKISFCSWRPLITLAAGLLLCYKNSLPFSLLRPIIKLEVTPWKVCFAVLSA